MANPKGPCCLCIFQDKNVLTPESHKTNCPFFFLMPSFICHYKTSHFLTDFLFIFEMFLIKDSYIYCISLKKKIISLIYSTCAFHSWGAITLDSLAPCFHIPICSTQDKRSVSLTSHALLCILVHWQHAKDLT